MTTAQPRPQSRAFFSAHPVFRREEYAAAMQRRSTDKVVTVEPDGTGPTPTETFDADADQALGSGNDSAPGGARPREQGDAKR